ncbi:Surfactin synthase thioesterase subunit [Streptomyces zhaozhouensis]|uniref:Surfactin synthase thioesterase subunit n=1 Tax=Streptomyces zhaozhouensis TaxID=1300267 RepID=A0A286DVI2_9ACTN|nr:alpha/beta fold hydrolase [Streptomyces zhaozhouensis]SOD62662.1 Surfactin synthase thioesterase subunit [Streptomyces zhaozhouensis]
MALEHAGLGPWLRCPSRRPRAGTRLVCLPHAGGAASSLRPWQSLLPPEVEVLTVQYPGREDRFHDPLVETMDALAREVVAAVAPVLDRPYALFGHSMGSAVAYEVALELQRTGHPAPVRLLASGRPAPQRAPGGDVHLRSDDALVDDMVRLGGTPREVMADPELRATVLRYVRNDYRLIERYRPIAPRVLPCPVSVFVGEDDPECGPAEAMTWAEVAPEAPRVRVFPGGHFFLAPQRERVAEAVCRELDLPALRPARSWPSTP